MLPFHASQRLLADVAAGVSVGGAAATWIHQANDILQLIATLVAIASGLYAIRFYIKRGKDE